MKFIAILSSIATTTGYEEKYMRNNLTDAQKNRINAYVRDIEKAGSYETRETIFANLKVYLESLEWISVGFDGRNTPLSSFDVLHLCEFFREGIDEMNKKDGFSPPAKESPDLTISP